MCPTLHAGVTTSPAERAKRQGGLTAAALTPPAHQRYVEGCEGIGRHRAGTAGKHVRICCAGPHCHHCSVCCMVHTAQAPLTKCTGSHTRFICHQRASWNAPATMHQAAFDFLPLPLLLLLPGKSDRAMRRVSSVGNTSQGM